MINIIIYFLGFWICLLNLTWILGYVTNRKIKFSLKLLILSTLFSFIGTLCIQLNLMYLKVFFSILSLILFSKVIIGVLNKKMLFYSITIWGFGLLFDLMFMTLFSLIINKFSLNIYFFIPIEYILTFVLQLIYNIIARTKLFSSIVKNLYNIFNKINVYLIIVLIIGLLYISTSAVINLHDFSNILVIFVSGILGLWIIIDTIYIIYLKRVNRETSKLLLNNNKFYVDINIDFRKFKHNLLHKLNGVKTYSNKKAAILVDEIIKDCKLLKYSNKEIDKLPIGINGLIQQMLYDKDNIEVLVENNISNDILEITSSKNYIRLCEIIGVSLDNAFEAMKGCKNRIIYISLGNENDQLVVIIKNTFSSFIDIDKLGTINYTTKGNNHGIGLFSILFNKSLKVKLKIINDMFETRITVPIINN